MKSYVEFVEIEKKPKTSVYEVRAKSDGYVLGIIKWYGPWRQYWFEPTENTGLEWRCLDEISAFIKKLMDARKER